MRVRYGNDQRARFTVADQKRADALRDLARELLGTDQPATVSRETLENAARAPERELDLIRKVVEQWRQESSARAQVAPKPQTKATTFADVANDWISGNLHARYPDHVKAKKTADDDAGIFKALAPTIGDVPIRAFTVEHAHQALASLPFGLASSTRRHYAQFVAKVLKLAVYPLRLIEASPLPPGFLPKVKTTVAFASLMPREDAALLACVAVPLDRRVLYAFLAREGCRVSEAVGLRWSDLNLRDGVVTLDRNKTDDPRAWALDPGVRVALERYHRLVGGRSAVFEHSERHQAATFRDDLRTAGVDRAQLFETSASRKPIRVHDLRATFITLALAAGRNEAWISDRTGHKSSLMINRYKRPARAAVELNLGALAPMHEAIPELGPEGGPSDGPGGETLAPDSGKKRNNSRLVAPLGLEPRRLSAADFKSAAYAIPPRSRAPLLSVPLSDQADFANSLVQPACRRECEPKLNLVFSCTKSAACPSARSQLVKR